MMRFTRKLFHCPAAPLAVSPALVGLIILSGLSSVSHGAVLPATGASYTGSATAGTPAVITGNATLVGLTTTEGSYTNLRGATANSVVTANTLNSIGTVPGNANNAVTGLSVNDGVNNLQSGNFQFPNGFDANTRFFILESAPQSSTLGDPTVVTLIDADNNAIGSLTLSLAASNWTSSPANTTNTALATVTYAATQATPAQKVGAVTFSLADFTGTGNTNLATGIRIVSGTVDPNVVGIYSVSGSFPPSPEPPAAVNILFVGNSFTHGHAAPVINYNQAAITDANGTGYGGVPGIFKQFTVDAHLNYNVTIEAVSSMTLGWHYSNKTNIIFQAQWQQVFLQDQSAQALPSNHGGNLTDFQNGATSLESGIHARSPDAHVFLYETWARADMTYPSGSSYYGQTIEVMGNDVHNGYYGEATLNPNIFAVAPAGDAWLRAIGEGVAHRNPYGGPNDGLFNLWYTDYMHGSVYGYFLDSLVVFGAATGRDPRTLGYTRVASDFGISSTDCTSLERVAFETLTNAGTKPIVNLLGSYAVTREASATYTDSGAIASDVLDGSLNPAMAHSTVVAKHPGAYLVSWEATNSVGLTGFATRTVIITDTTPPVVTVPGNLVVYATTSNGAVVSFSTSATDIADGSVATSNSPASGTLFPLGKTIVTTTAMDAAGNAANKAFTVTVSIQPVGLGELEPPEIHISGSNVDISIAASVAGRHYQLQICDDLTAGLWQDIGPVLIGDGNNLLFSTPVDPTVRCRFYRPQLK